jgi:hypothetical protein
MAQTMVLSEDEALELLAFLVTAARTQAGEPNEYGPLRLLSAATRLGDFMRERASPETRSLLSGPLREIPSTETRMADYDAYVAKLDALCSAVARHLVNHFGLEAASDD